MKRVIILLILMKSIMNPTASLAAVPEITLGSLITNTIGHMNESLDPSTFSLEGMNSLLGEFSLGTPRTIEVTFSALFIWLKNIETTRPRDFKIIRSKLYRHVAHLALTTSKASETNQRYQRIIHFAAHYENRPWSAEDCNFVVSGDL